MRFLKALAVLQQLLCLSLLCAAVGAASSASAASSVSVSSIGATGASPTTNGVQLKDACVQTFGSLGCFFKNTLQHQEQAYTKQRTMPLQHKHRAYLKNTMGSAPQTKKDKQPSSLWFYARVGLAGGLAGASGTAVLYPMDCAKTLRQSQPAKYPSVRQALRDLCVTRTVVSESATGTVVEAANWHIQRAYAGWAPAVCGAIPSSALYFGAYESMKRFITARTTTDQALPASRLHRLGIHATAAASGNILSSMVFVPKELVKQQMQFQGEGARFGKVLLQILKRSGVRGLYCGYQATLMRNIPSAMLRFVLYEELKWAWYTNPEPTSGAGGSSSKRGKGGTLVGIEPLQFSWQLFAAGAVAGALASGIMTPVDVLKTRLSTGTCPIDVGSCVKFVLKEEGWAGLYAGAGSRILWSGAFSAIGFGSFEAAKTWLGVADVAVLAAGSGAHKAANPRLAVPARSTNISLGGKRVRILTDPQRRLDHALSAAYDTSKR